MPKEQPFPARPMRRQSLADRLAEDVANLILDGTYAAGDALPSETELATRYGVSRAVVRGGTQQLAARGLVDVRQGKGVFVTESQREALGDALLLSLRRAGATVWDLEQFEQMLLPAVASLVVSNASDEDIARIRVLAENYIKAFEDIEDASGRDLQRSTQDLSERPFKHILHAIYAATHNEVIRQIGEQLVSLRRPRQLMGVDDATALEMDSKFLGELLSILETQDPDAAQERVRNLMKLPRKAVAAMKATPIGEIAKIDAPSHTEK